MRPAQLLLTLVLFCGCEDSTVATSKKSSTTGALRPTGEGLLAVGAKAPKIKATAHTGEKISLEGLRGKPVIVYFYPKDDTPGCTVEAKGLAERWPEIQATGAVVLGVSTDDNSSHKAFAEKHKLPFLLLPDEDRGIAQAFGVDVTLGFAKRVTFVIDQKGVIVRVFPRVNPLTHADDVLTVLATLRGGAPAGSASAAASASAVPSATPPPASPAAK